VTERFRQTQVAGPILSLGCPNLKSGNWHIRSPWNDSYQCISWAACYTDRHMWPHQDYWWFPGLPLFPIDTETPTDYFIQGFSVIGYRPCTSRQFEFGYQKVAIYANDAGVTHMARQHFWGRGWLSKLGVHEDIFHRKLEDVEGDMSPFKWQYGVVSQILKRSWWAAIANHCAFRCLKAQWKLWIYRLRHESWEKP
jgi:hypothetical protein